MRCLLWKVGIFILKWFTNCSPKNKSTNWHKQAFFWWVLDSCFCLNWKAVFTHLDEERYSSTAPSGTQFRWRVAGFDLLEDLRQPERWKLLQDLASAPYATYTHKHTHCFKLWYETILNSKRNPGKALWSLKSDFWIEESFYTWPSDSSKLHFPENTNKITSEQTTDVSACSSLSLTGQQSDTTLQRKVIQQMSPYTSVTAVINITWHQQTQIHLF